MGKGRCFFNAVRTWEFMVFFFDLRYEWNIENVTKGYTCRELNVYIYICIIHIVKLEVMAHEVQTQRKVRLSAAMLFQEAPLCVAVKWL